MNQVQDGEHGVLPLSPDPLSSCSFRSVTKKHRVVAVCSRPQRVSGTQDMAGLVQHARSACQQGNSSDALEFYLHHVVMFYNRLEGYFCWVWNRWNFVTTMTNEWIRARTYLGTGPDGWTAPNPVQLNSNQMADRRSFTEVMFNLEVSKIVKIQFTVLKISLS